MKLLYFFALSLLPCLIQSAEFDHSAFDILLKKYVIKDSLQYQKFMEEKNSLEKYLDSINQTDPKKLDKQNQLAFYINAYNAYTIKLILDNYENLKSIRDIPSSWSKKFCKIGGAIYSLDQIENEILRKEFNENRIHFAINCASISCPSLQKFAFTAEKLEEQLEASTISFVNSKKGIIFKADNNLYINKIFDWYKNDFGDSEQELIKFIQKYTHDDNLKKADSKKIKIAYLDYNWELNDQKH